MLEGRELFSASAGDLDAAFGAAGLATARSTLSAISATHAAVQADGKVVVVGKSDDRFAVARFEANGAPDQSFGPSGTGIVLTQAGPAGTTSAAASVAVQTDGKIVVVGSDGKRQSFDVVRYTSTGKLDTTFGGSGIVRTDVGGLIGPFSSVDNETASDVVVQPDGKIVVAGSAETGGLFSSNRDFIAVRYNANGSVDTSFGAESGAEVVGFGANEVASAVAIDTNGSAATNPLFGTIVLAGTQTDDSQVSHVAVARLTPGGHLDGRFSGDGQLTGSLSSTTSVSGRSVLIQPGGGIVVAGTVINRSNGAQDFGLVEFNADGSPNLNFGSSSTGWQRTDFGGNDQANVIIRSFNGDLIVGGSSDGKLALAAYSPGGKPDAHFSGDGRLTTSAGETSAVTGLAAAPGRRFVAVGSGTAFHAARYIDLVPTVEINADRTDVFEHGTTGTVLVIDRYESIPVATRIYLGLSGTAQLKVVPVASTGAKEGAGATGGASAGTGDYTLAGLGRDAKGYFVDIPAYSNVAIIGLTTVDNGIIGGVKTAAFTILDNDLYDVAPHSSTTINIHESDTPTAHLPGGSVSVGNKT